MPEPKGGALVKSVESLLAEKRAVAEKEKELIEGLNRVLTQMGYEVVPTKVTAPNGRKGRRRGRKPGRPRGKRRGRPAKAGGPKRTGQPPKGE